jgi:DNA-binding MarR family transcriptional regulator
MSTSLAIHPVATAARLRPVLLKLNRELRREIQSLGVTGGQASLLFAIQRRPGIGLGELATQERMSAPAMSKYVDRLEAAGLLTKTPGEDRRRVGLRVTPAGERILRSVKSRRTAWLAARLKHLSAKELAAIERAIDPLAKLLEDPA